LCKGIEFIKFQAMLPMSIAPDIESKLSSCVRLGQSYNTCCQVTISTFKLEFSPVCRLWRPPIHNMDPSSKLGQRGIPVDARGIPWDVLTTSRFVSYACLAWVVLGGSFWLFRELGW